MDTEYEKHDVPVMKKVISVTENISVLSLKTVGKNGKYKVQKFIKVKIFSLIVLPVIFQMLKIREKYAKRKKEKSIFIYLKQNHLTPQKVDDPQDKAGKFVY